MQGQRCAASAAEKPLADLALAETSKPTAADGATPPPAESAPAVATACAQHTLKRTYDFFTAICS